MKTLCVLYDTHARLCVCVCVHAMVVYVPLPKDQAWGLISSHQTASDIFGCYSYLRSWDKQRLWAFCPNMEAPDCVSGTLTTSPFNAPGLARASIASECSSGFK